MRLRSLSSCKPTAFLPVILFGALSAIAQQPPTGVHPRATAEDYAVKGQSADAVLAASLVPADQLKHFFAFDITRDYLVFEVACYPSAGRSPQINSDDFVVKTGNKDELAHQADAATIAAVIQKEHIPNPHSRETSVMTEANVGYESGTDPYTGRRVHGVSTGAGVGVANGADRPDPYPTPGGLPQDRDLLEAQLHARSFPEGRINHPVAGYLYFPRSAVKKTSNGIWQLQYLGSASTAETSQIVQLPVPAKNH